MDNTSDEHSEQQRLPSNAQQQQQQSQPTVPIPQRRRKGTGSIARATDRLATPPVQLPRSLPLDDAGTEAMARRVGRHLVSTRTSIGSRMTQGDEDGYAGDTNDEEDEGMPVDPLTLPSGDVTYGIYRWHRSENAPQHTRRGSFGGVASDSEWDMPYSQSQMAVPGAFRRQFVRDRAEREGRAPVTVLTYNFVDFIGLYGHFAGGDYPSDEDEPEERESERAVLVRRSSSARPTNTASGRKAFFLLLKAFVGTGVLVLPKAFANGGLAASAGVVAVVAWYAWHCMTLLGEVYLRVGASYSDLGAQLFGPWAGTVITVSIVTAQVGFCSAYTIFVATNARSVWDALTGCRMSLSPTFWVLAQLLAYIPLAWVRRIKQFAPFAMTANACIMAGLAYVLLYDVGHIWSHGMAQIVMFNPTRFPLLVGTAVFAFEGVTLVIPVVDSMARPNTFPKVLTAVMLVCIVVFCGIAALSYMAFGESVETVVLLSLPPAAPTVLVQLLYSLAIMLSVPLQMFPAIRILEAGIFPRSGKGNPVVKWQKNMFRALLAAVVAAVAIFGAEQLDNFIAIIGALSCTPLSFIYPALLHYRISTGRWTRIKDLILAAAGFVILIYVTYMGIKSWGASPPPVDQCLLRP
ncbi:hypothetical protein H4R20_001016 [Coemansia guatemalensis]|uniref:Amino acid transporter transmembrane domain-containing protein n=1 Tax=Coemansia guatemalensis TaxID=2761395 RepID=A0A9W8I561_9FUNG|nr:hypothetical protein H4R20_001016 [Coemansia guatemalensis]